MLSAAMTDTIFALSSGALPAGVAVIRVSGPDARNTLLTMFGKVPEPRRAAYGTISDVEGNPIDSGLILFFQGPASFTGEDVVEFHMHGGRAVIAAMFKQLGTLGLRSAEQGEFTKRAFLNGKLDLTEAEALADLIEAETEAQRRFAVMNASGGQKELYEGWRGRLIEYRALLEADLDFSDQEDVPGSVAEKVGLELEQFANEIDVHVSSFRRAEILRQGFDVVIIGRPNAGKSSLLNALARRDVALVSDEPGTTRDLIEIALDLGGVKVKVTDTAGIRDGAGKVEAMGIDRALSRASEADLVVQLQDLSSDEEPDLFEGALCVGSKLDLATGDFRLPFAISVETGQGISELLREIELKARDALGQAGDILPARLRHIELLTRAAAWMRDAISHNQIELKAEALRQASHEIGLITGRVDVEEILDVIFSRFCIGK